MDILSNLGNSRAGIIDAIQVEYRKHWTRGLRQAELIIVDKQMTLAKNLVAFRQLERRIKIFEDRFKYTNYFQWLTSVPILGKSIEDKILSLGESIHLMQLEIQKSEALFRDCNMELCVAQEQKQWILGQHPEAMEKTYEILQQEYSSEALVGQKEFLIDTKMVSALKGIPEEVVAIIFESTPKVQELLIKRVNELQISCAWDTQKLPEQRFPRSLAEKNNTEQ